MQGRENEEENEPLLIAADVLKIVSWHIPSLKKAFENGFLDFIKIHSPDIICLQVQNEDKTGKNATNQEKKNYAEIGSDKDQFLIDGYKGYIIANHENNTKDAETVMFTKIRPIKVFRTNLDEDENKDSPASNDSSIMTIEFTNFFVVNAIAPGKTVGDDKAIKWFEKLQKLINDLDSQKTTILCGDFKVAHQDLDISNSDNQSFNYYEDANNRKRFFDFLSSTYVDIFRSLHPDKQQFSYFASETGRAGESKARCRTDYFIAQSEAIETKIVVDCSIANTNSLSKHAPIVLLLDKEKLISVEHDLLVDSLPPQERRNVIFHPIGDQPIDEHAEEEKNEPITLQNSNELPNQNDQNNLTKVENNSKPVKEKIDQDDFVYEYEDEYGDEYGDEYNESESSEHNEEEEIELANGHKIKTRRSKGRYFNFSRQAVKGGKRKSRSGKVDDDDYAPNNRPVARSKPKPKKNPSSSTEPHRGRGRPPRKVKPEEQ